MKYGVNFQRLPKGAARPVDEGEAIEDFTTDDAGFMLLPNVGDYVTIDQSLKKGAHFKGRVRSRLFTYLADYCLVNIVVEDADDDWGELIKE